MTGEIDVWGLIEEVIPHADKLLLYGPPGTGKTTVASTFGLDGREVFSVTLTEDTPAESLRGHYLPVGDRFEWMDGPGLQAWRPNPADGRGGRLVLNEIDHAQGDALDFLMVLCDDPAIARLTLPKHDHETVRPAPGFQVVATMNGQPDHLPEALADRFPVAIYIGEVRAAALAALPEDLRAAAATTTLITDPRRRIGIRKWFAFARLRDEVGADLAGKAVFGSAYRDLLANLDIAVAPGGIAEPF